MPFFRSLALSLALVASAWPLQALSVSGDEPTVSYRIVLESPSTHVRPLDEEGTALVGFPWEISGQADCDASFPCASDTHAVSWRGQALAEAPSDPSLSPTVRVQLVLTEHTNSGSRIKNVAWQGSVDEVYPDKTLGKWFRFRAASRLNP